MDQHTSTTPDHVRERCEHFRRTFQAVKDEVQKVIVGHDAIVEGVLTAIFTGGNVLLEGVPGLGKTMLVRTLADVMDLEFSRIQFTPDLMPADIIGTNIVMEDPDTGRRRFEFQRGPIFAQLLLADEINRATPKSQSALLEAMQEKTVTVGGEHHTLAAPFFVLATQNPIEQEGTYPLPEAQLDRFIFKLAVGYSKLTDLMTIVDRTTGEQTPTVEAKIDARGIIDAQHLVREVVIAPHVKEYAARLVLATHPEGEFAPDITNRYVRCGASPRGAQALVLAGKVKALTDGRFHVAPEDIEAIAKPALRHRILLNFEAEADRVQTDDIVSEIVGATRREPVLSHA
ncbi:MAG: MoxR family ATPase [Phycisphaerales bacterium]